MGLEISVKGFRLHLLWAPTWRAGAPEAGIKEVKVVGGSQLQGDSVMLPATIHTFLFRRSTT